MKNRAHPPEDTLETRSQLHDALRAHADEAHILRLIARGTDPGIVDHLTINSNNLACLIAGTHGKERA